MNTDRYKKGMVHGARCALLVALALSFAAPALPAHALSPADSFDLGANDTVTALGVQADGKIVVGGRFTTLSGAHPVAAQAQPISSGAPSSAPDPASVSAALRSSSVMFIENVGQFADGARFQVRGGNGTMWLADDAIYLNVFEPQAPPKKPGLVDARTIQNPQLEIQKRKAVNLKLSFVGANAKPVLEPFDRLDTRVSYYIGNDAAKWHADVPVWGGVRYKNIYPGIDLELSSERGQWQPRVVTHAGANLNAVRLRVDGADKIALDGERLRLTTTVGEYTMPLLQVNSAGGAKLSRPTIAGNDVVSPFGTSAIGKSPSAVSDSSDLLYGTYLGGSGTDYAFGIAVDSNGAAYVSGYTASPDFSSLPGTAAFVAKLNAAGSALDYITFLGGGSFVVGGVTYADASYGYGIAVDSSGAAYVTGTAGSCTFPTTQGVIFPICPNYPPVLPNQLPNYLGDGFAVKLNPTGSLAYSTYLGVAGMLDTCSDGQPCYTGAGRGLGIAIDSSGVAYVAGDFISHLTGNSVFALKLNATGSARPYFKFLGGLNTFSGFGRDIAVDPSGAAYVTGVTQSADFPTTPGAFQTSCLSHALDTADAFVVKINPSGSIVYSTCLTGSAEDAGEGIAVDPTSGEVYVIGATKSPDFPTTPGAFRASWNNNTQRTVFVVKLNAAGSALVYGTFLWGGDIGYGIAIDSSGAAYVTGTGGGIPTTPGAFQTDGRPLFVAKLNPSGSTLIYSTHFGGTSQDDYPGIAIDSSGAAYLTGHTLSSDFPTTPAAFDTTFGGLTALAYGDAFAAKLAMIPHDYPVPLAGIGLNSAQVGSAAFTLTVTGGNFFGVGTVVRWNGVDRATTYQGSTQLMASIPASDIATTGVAYITVFNPSPGGGTSNPLPFYITQTGAGVTASNNASGANPSASTGGSGPNTPGSVTATGNGGGTVSVAIYSGNPQATACSNCSGAYMDVHVAPGNTFTSLTIVDCNLDGGTQVYWWNGTTWALASNQSYNSSTHCVTITVNNFTSPSLSDLTGTPFGAAGGLKLFLPLILR